MGVCMIPVLDENGREENKGIRLDPFFYSGKNIISLTVYNTKKTNIQFDYINARYCSKGKGLDGTDKKRQKEQGGLYAR